MQTIVLIDDHVLLRTGLALLIKSSFDQTDVLESDTIHEFRQLYPRISPALVIVAVNERKEKVHLLLPEQIKKWYPQARIIFYDDYCKHTDSIIANLKMGVHGYLLKNSSMDELVDCIKTVKSGKMYLCPELFELLLPNFIERKISPTLIDKLTPHESQIAAYLNQGMKTGEIAAKLGRNSSTISVMKARIFKKMNVDNVVALKQAFDND